MKQDCGCYIDQHGKRYAWCPEHNGNNERDRNASMSLAARLRAEARKTYVAKDSFRNGMLRHRGITVTE